MLNHEYDYRPNWTTRSPVTNYIITVTISEKINAFFFGVRAFNTKWPTLRKLIAELHAKPFSLLSPFSITRFNFFVYTYY